MKPHFDFSHRREPNVYVCVCGDQWMSEDDGVKSSMYIWKQTNKHVFADDITLTFYSPRLNMDPF